MSARTLMTADDVRRALVRIAHEIVEQTHGAENIVLVGLRTRGAPLAERLSALIGDFEQTTVPHGALDISFYRDDLDSRGIGRAVQPTDLPAEIRGRDVVLVDDVLYTGRTIRAALDALIDFGRPRRILLAVLVDRGHRELPIRADFVGKNIPTRREEDVAVLLRETDGRDEVLVRQPQEAER
jgi:pyrimidine operon attenuation protein / uracil phosphoribosyltransferase